MHDPTISPTSIIEQLEPVLSITDEEVVPARVELMTNNSYTPEYAWMYAYEKRLKYRLEKVLCRKFSYKQERILFGAGGCVSECLSNAYVHGHWKDPQRPISVWTAVSEKGVGVAITDEGAGFNIDEVMQRFESSLSFFHIAGNGFSNLLRSRRVKMNYQRGGTRVCLLCQLDPV